MPKPEHPRPQALTASPVAKAKRLAADELHSKIGPGDRRWLNDNPRLWARGLIALIEDSKTHTYEQRAALNKLRGDAEYGGNPSPEYLAAKAEFEDMARRREHFRMVVRNRLDEVRDLVGHRPVDLATVGDIVVELYRVAHLIAVDPERARTAAVTFAERLVQDDADTP